MSEMAEMHCLCWQVFRDSRAAQSYLGSHQTVIYFHVDCGWLLQGKIKVRLVRVSPGWQWQPVGWQSRIAKVLLEERYHVEFLEIVA